MLVRDVVIQSGSWWSCNEFVRYLRPSYTPDTVYVVINAGSRCCNSGRFDKIRHYLVEAVSSCSEFVRCIRPSYTPDTVYVVINAGSRCCNSGRFWVEL